MPVISREIRILGGLLIILVENEKMKSPLTTFKLRHNGFVDPRWMRVVQSGKHKAIVDLTGKNTILKGEALTLDEQLPPGTPVLVWLDRNFYCCTEFYFENHQAAIRKAADEESQKSRQLENEKREEAGIFNATINVPVKWTVGQKDVLSGLSETSWGDGRNARTVNHILLQEDLAEGRLRRGKGDFLCTSGAGANGKQWAGAAQINCVDGDGKAYLPKVTCKQCLKLIKRWMTIENF